jgi:tRNA-uridine 2-sulfurtransferase
MDDFLRAELQNESGKAVDVQGMEIGQHDGVLLHTLGERVHLTNALPGPWFVVRKDIPNNTLVVSKERVLETPPAKLSLEHSNWFAKPDTEPVTGQYRYHGPHIEGSLSGNEFVSTAAMNEPVASGQSLVIYRGDQVLGGGIIG